MFHVLRQIAAVVAVAIVPMKLSALESSLGTLRVETVATGLDNPWGITFLPGEGVLITEQGGKLFRLTPQAQLISVSGVAEVAVRGQGGLLDVVAARDFETSREVFFTYAKPQGRNEGTALAVAKLNSDGTMLTDWRDLFVLASGTSGGRHFGSRVVEGRDGRLFVTIGDRGDRMSAQNLSIATGSVIRVARDGTIPDDNPFVDAPAAQPAIWSFGHRNSQGAALDAQGRLWIVEHGARGGDEVNFIRKGANYGWPIIAYGRHYTGFRIGEGTHKDGMEQPATYWDPSIAPSGMMIYGTNSDGGMFPEWRGDMFIGSLKFDYITRLTADGETASEAEQLRSDQTGRVRDVREAPDGSIWFLSVNDGALYRVSR